MGRSLGLKFGCRKGIRVLCPTESGVERQKLPWGKHCSIAVFSSAENLLVVYVQREGIACLQATRYLSLSLSF